MTHIYRYNVALRMAAYVLVAGFSLGIILSENFESNARSYISENISNPKAVNVAVVAPLMTLADAKFEASGPGSIWWTFDWNVAQQVQETEQGFALLSQFGRRKISLDGLGQHEGAADLADSDITDEGFGRAVRGEQNHNASLERMRGEEKVAALVVADKKDWLPLMSIPLFGNEAPKAITENLVQVAAAAEREVVEEAPQVSAPPQANQLPQNVVQTGFVRIVGKLSDEARDYPGHFEVGFYRALGPQGNPVGAPSPQFLLNNGRTDFDLKVSRRAKGFLFARYVPAESGSVLREWYGFPQFIDLGEVVGDNIAVIIPVDRRVSGALIAAKSVGVSAETMELRGQISTMFQQPAVIPVGGAKIRVRGTKIETDADSEGKFQIQMPALFGRISIEILKAGYQPKVVELDVEKGQKLADLGNVEIPSQKAVQTIAQTLGVRIVSNTSIVVLEAKSKDGSGGLQGISANAKVKVDGPFYFSEQGVPQASLKATTSDGRMIFFNVPPGVEFFETFVLGRDYSPVMISTLGAKEVVHKKLEFQEGDVRLSGRILDPVSSRLGVPTAVSGARVHIVGTNQTVETDQLGAFEFTGQRLFKNSEVIFEVTRPGFYKHRFTVRNTKRANLNEIDLFVFSQGYVNRMAKSLDIKLDAAQGLVLGSVSSSERLRMDTLLDHTTENSARDFYFDSHNAVQGSHAYTEPGFGTYAIFSVGPGRALIHGYSTKGELRYSEFVYSSPSTISILVSN